VAARTKTVFVIMPFAEEFYPGFQHIIQPAIEKVGLDCIRADKEPQGYIQKKSCIPILCQQSIL
jgi:hypothetical protein